MNFELEEFYKVISREEQYNKYGLLSLNENRNLRKPGASPQYIQDKKYGSVEVDKRIPEIILEKLWLIRRNTDYIKDFSVRPDLKNGIIKKELIILKDEKEFGKYFSFQNLKENFSTKLYSLENDSLWINIENNNITFEEIIDDLKTEDDIIKTQVVHCEYFFKNNKFYISHLDHEYIFYSLEEYCERLYNIKQKGNIKKREKTIKIDNSKIPFIFILEEGLDKEEINILLFILSEYFKRKDLLIEYFQKIKDLEENP